MAAPLLRQLAIVDLNIKFARKLEENKIRHYVVPAAYLYLNQLEANKPVSLIVKEYIKQTEGIDVEFEPSQDTNKPLKLTDVSNSILVGRNDITKALKKLKSQSMIHQTISYGTFTDKLKAFINQNVINPINRTIFRIKTGTSISNYGLRFAYGTIPYFTVTTKTNTVHLTHHIAVAFEEDQFVDASEVFVRDLSILTKNKLILGHLVMPSIMPLADTVGDGKKTYVLFSSIVIDSTVKNKLLGQDGKLSSLGVQYECPEGGINYLDGVDPRSKYEIEEVNLMEGMHSKNNDVVIQNYNAIREESNRAARDMKTNMDNFDIEKSSQHTSIREPGALAGQPSRGETVLKVNFNIKKKTEE